jgi:hypothetical protein
MRARLILACSLLAAVWGAPVQATSQDTAVKANNELSVTPVRKTCDCVRQHPSGFPYIEPRITECKTFKDAQGKVKSIDCINCYTVCSTKPTS